MESHCVLVANCEQDLVEIDWACPRFVLLRRTLFTAKT